MNKYVKNIYYVETTLSDHSIVVLHFKNDDVEKVPRILILNNLRFSDDIYKEIFLESMEIEKDCILYDTSLIVRKDNLKYKIKKCSQSYSKRRDKESNNEYFTLQKKIRLSENIANWEKIDIEKYEALKCECQSLN